MCVGPDSTLYYVEKTKTDNKIKQITFQKKKVDPKVVYSSRAEIVMI